QRKENCDQISFFLTNGRKKTVANLLEKMTVFYCKSYVNRLERSCQGSIGGGRCSLSSMELLEIVIVDNQKDYR
ncbi:hypothetical protein, partial [Lacticaseibacillus rhamnosus]